MNNINLLPWRETLNRRKNKDLLIMSLSFWGSCMALGLFLVATVSAELDIQNNRNQFLSTQIAELKHKVRDIEALQTAKQELLERIEIIQDIQQHRMHIVHVFDELVQKLPTGVTFDEMSKRQNEIHLQGRAQSNARVSELMNQVDTSRWIGESDLSLVDVNELDDNQLSTFSLVFTEKGQNFNDVEESSQ